MAAVNPSPMPYKPSQRELAFTKHLSQLKTAINRMLGSKIKLEATIIQEATPLYQEQEGQKRKGLQVQETASFVSL